MSNDVTTNFFANERDAQAAIVRLEKKHADLEAKIKSVGRASRRASEEGVSGFENLIVAGASAAATYLSVGRAVQFSTDALLKYNREIEAAGRKGEDANKRLNVATGFSDPQASRKLALAGIASGVFDANEARDAGAELTRSGIPLESARQVFEGFAVHKATAKTPSSFSEYADLLGDELKQAGLTATPENLDKQMRSIFAMQRGTELGVSDFQSARETLRTLNAGKGKERHAKALARIGLKFADVDLTGETTPEALERIGAGLAKLSAEQRPTVAKELGFSADLVDNLVDAATNRAANLGQYDRSVRELTSGRGAAEKRIAGQRQLLHEAKAGRFGTKDVVDAADLAAEGMGVNPIARALGGVAGTAAGEYVSPAYAGRGFAAGAAFPKVALGLGMGLMPGAGGLPGSGMVSSAWDLLRSAWGEGSGQVNASSRAAAAAAAPSGEAQELLREFKKMNEQLESIGASSAATADELKRRTPRREGMGPP